VDVLALPSHTSKWLVCPMKPTASPLSFTGCSSPQVVGIVYYIFCTWFLDSFVTNFIVCVVLIALDFWTVKNVTGRKLVGLRWWNEANDSGSAWRFEQVPDGTRVIHAGEKRMFWIGLFTTVVAWPALAFFALVRIKLDYADSTQEDSREEALLTPDAALNDTQQAAVPAEVQDQQLVVTTSSAGAQIEKGDLESTRASTTDTGGGGGEEEEGQHGGMEGCSGEEANQAQPLLLGTPSDKQGEVEVEHQSGEAGDGDEGSGVPLPLSEGDTDTGHAEQSTGGGEEGEEDQAADDKGNEGRGRGSEAEAGRQAAAMGEQAGTAAGKEADTAAAGEEAGKAAAGEEAGEAAAGEEASAAASGEEGLRRRDETGGVAAETDADVPGKVAVCADLAAVPGDLEEEGSVRVPLAGAAPAEVEEVECHALPHSMTQDDTAPTAREAGGVPEAAAAATTIETSLLGDVEAASEALEAATAAEGAGGAGVSTEEVEGEPAEEAAPAAAEPATAVTALDAEEPGAAATAAEEAAEAVETGAGGGAAAGMSGAPAAQAGSAGVEGEDGLVGAGAELAALAAQVPGLLVVSGPSGVGKGTLIARLMALHPHRFGFCTSHTTRGPRPGEVDGQHYHFTTQSAIQSEIARGAFLEHASVHGNSYGTSLAAVAAVCSLGKLPLLDIDVQGARKVRAEAGNSQLLRLQAAEGLDGSTMAVVWRAAAALVRSSVVGGCAASVFVAPPSLPELEARLRGRATGPHPSSAVRRSSSYPSEDRIQARLSAAAAEMEEAASYGDTVVNGQLDRAYADLLRAIQRQLPGTFTQEELQEAEEAAVEAERKAAEAEAVAETTVEEAAPAAAEPATAVTALDAEEPGAAATAAEEAAEAVETGAGGGAAAGMSGAPAAQAGSAGVEGEDGLVGAGAELAALAAQVPGLLVVSGPSGVGKGTLIARLMALHPHRFGFCTSHTTRGPRPGEVDGQHYHFTTQSAMQSEIARGAFLEHASVHGNSYGTSLAAVAAVCSLGKLPLLDIDVQGARKVRSSVVGERAASVFVAPPSLPELEARLRGRATESEDRIQARLSAAAAEMEEAASYGDTVVNGQLDRAYADLLCAIQRQLPGTFTQEELQEAEEAAVAAEQKSADAESVAETIAEEAAPAAAEPATAVTALNVEAPEAAAAEGAAELAVPGETASKAAISGTLPVAESALEAGPAGPESATAPASNAGLPQSHAPTALASSNAESEKGAATHVASLSPQPPPLSPRPDALHSPSPPAAPPMPGFQRSTASPLQVSRAAALVAPGSSRMGSAGSLAPSMASSTAAAGAPIQQYLDSTVVSAETGKLHVLLHRWTGWNHLHHDITQACRKVVEKPNSGRATDRVKGKVVTVEDFRTSRVSSAMISPQPCEEELDRSKPTRPGSAWSKRFEAPVRGLMWCPKLDQATPGDIGRWVDRDWNAALNLQRIGEASSSDKEYPALGFKKLRDRAPKAQARQPVAQ
ncbi:hypothetical protein QJQ45_029547, partial [Haematococcus lacustris]